MSITTIIGPMFSGKTSELIRLIKREIISKKKCLIIKYQADNRYDTYQEKSHLTTHDKIVYTDCEIRKIDKLNEELSKELINHNYQVVGIDEGFFFEGLKEFCNTLANHGIQIYVSSIDGSYIQETFTEIAKIISISEKVIKLSGICFLCRNSEAYFTIRINNSKELFLVGGEDTYQCVCRKCLQNFRKENSCA